MCEPATIIAASSLALSAGATYANYEAQKKQAGATKDAAIDALHESWKAINTREGQEQAATAQSVMSIDRAARTQRGIAALVAGESGVSGVSVDALLNDITSQELTAKTTERRNLDMTMEQLQLEKQGAKSVAESRIAGAPAPNPFLAGLTIGSQVLDFGQTMYDRKHPGGTSGS